MTHEDAKLIGEVLRAAAYGPFFEDSEFHTLFGLDRDEMRAIAEEWPEASKRDAASLAINNAFNNLLGYPHDAWAAWKRFSTASQAELDQAYRRWLLESGFRGSLA